MQSPHRLLGVLLTFVLLAFQPAFADDASWPIARGPSHEPHPYFYNTKKWQNVPKDFLEDATACVLYAGNTYLVESDGTVETITHEITRLNGRKGIEKLGEYRHITYDPTYQKLILNEAMLHKADGRQIAVEPRHVQLRDVSTDYLVYDHEKELIISFPNLEVGDSLEVKWTLRGKNPEHGGQFFTRYTFGDPVYPTVLDELLVRVPADKSFRYASVSGRIDPAITENDEQHLYHWKAVNVKQMPQDENLPPREELHPSVVCTTFSSWAEVGRWKQQLRTDSWKASPEIRKAVEEITKGLTSPSDKARALTFWMRRNIRYVSSGERHDYTPHPPERVFANRYGDCKDTSQLLAVMLHEAGLPVALATLGTLEDGQIVESVPSPWGTHAILFVPLPDGEHWIDTTLSLGGWDFLPRDDRNRLCYVLDKEGHITLRRTPPPSADGNRFEQTTHVWVNADGSTRCERTIAAYGSAALGQRDSFLEVPVGERRRQVAAELQDANSRARLLELTFDEAAMRDFDRPVTSRMVFEVPGQFSGVPNREGSIADSRTWGRLLAYNLDYDRQVAFDLPAPFESRHRYVVHVPAAYALESMPHERIITSYLGKFEVHIATPPGDEPVRELDLTFLTRLEKTHIEPEMFDEYRRFHEEVSRAYRVWLTLKPSSDPTDVPILEGVLALAPEDSASAATLVRLYRQLGKTDDARRVLRKARHYRPDDVTLCELSVQCASDASEEENAQRELAKRFPDETRHTLALGQLLIQRGKHDAARTVLAPIAKDGTPTDRSQAHLYLARSYYHSGKPDEAMKHLKSAEEADPECVSTVEALQLRGHVCEDLSQLRDAARAYGQALEIDHNAEDALNGLVRLSLLVNNRVDAIDYLRRYTVVIGNEPTGLLQAADYYRRLERYDDAIELASKSLKQRADERGERILGLVHLRHGRYAEALAHLEKAGSDPGVLEGILRAMLSAGVLSRLPERLEQAKQMKYATDDLRQTCAVAREVLNRRQQLTRIASVPSGQEADLGHALDCLACAEHAHDIGRPADVVEQLLSDAFKVTGVPGPAFALRGRLALESGKLAQAATDAAKAVTLSPQDGEGYYVRGRVRLERGEAGALADLEKATELTEWRDAGVLHGFADGLFRAGKTAKALAVQREAVRLKPQDREMAAQLASFEKASQSVGVKGS